MIEKSSSVEPDGEMFVINAVAIEIPLEQEITISVNGDEVIESAESLTWFHLDDLEGCQLSVLLVSCLIFTQKDKHESCCGVADTHRLQHSFG